MHTYDTGEGVKVTLARGDITRQDDVEAIVNAANAELLPGGGVAGAIHRVAGPALAEESRPLAPISPGSCVVTSGHSLPNRIVLHCLGPVYGVDEPAEDLLASCYRKALSLADEAGVGSIAFPAISTGAFGFPVGRASEIALSEALGAAADLTHVREIRFVLFDDEALAAHLGALRALTS